MSNEYQTADATLYIKKGEGRTLRAGGLWVYDNEVDHIEGSYADGDILAVRDARGAFRGWGCISDNSRLRVRILSRREEDPVTPALLRRRVLDAWDYRKRVMARPEDLAACRLIFGEADLLPGITVDRFSDVLVMESLARGTDRFKQIICQALLEILAAEGIQIRMIYERSDARVRTLEGLERVKGPLYTAQDGSGDPVVEIVENGVRYHVDVENGQKTGFFLDQKYNRQAIRTLARDGRVLDCFTHTGAFALNAVMAGAREVWAVDASDTGIAQARENAALNGCLDRMRFETADVFELLPALEAQGETFDLVILDPPAFTKSRASVKKATAGYREINLRGLRLVRDGGFLATCSCSHFMEPALFARTISEAARDAHVRLRQVEYRTQAPDHPILWMDGSGTETSYYLKFYIFQVLR
ncbi:MAG: class I SAM-dependent rRNA methyltransferase [Butyrivibrio sp.]|nr:class I SAM-dependent rRNA methyltransferase [Butyrivibrio sp.]